MLNLFKKNKNLLFNTEIKLLQKYDDLRMRNDGNNPCEGIVDFDVHEYCHSILPDRGKNP